MTGKIYISLNEYEFTALQQQARRELRGVKDQAMLYILRGLNIVDSHTTHTDQDTPRDETKLFISA